MWCVLLLPLGAAMADIVTASSDPFSFPLTQPVKQPLKKAAEALALHVKQAVSPEHSLAVNWSVPASVEAKSGMVTLFNLQGKALAVFPLAVKKGSAVLPLAKGQELTGVYIVKLTFGTAAATIKLAACR
jgi:hypothetical protein